VRSSVDIIVLTINNINDTKEFVDYLYKNSNHELFNLIIVDQGSTDGTRHFLRELEITKDNVVVHFSETNLGFAGGCNLGATYAMSDLILFINNDALLGPDVLDRLIESMQTNGFDAVGPISNETGEIQRLWKEYDTKQYKDELIRHNEDLWIEFGTKVAEFHRLAGFCMLISRKAFEDVNGFSEDYGLGYYEDDDLCYRLRSVGYRLGVACGIFVHHHGSRSFNRAKLSSNTLMAKNRHVFLSKSYYQIQYDYDGENTHLVSVIICTYNRPELLPRAIESVLTQTYHNFELLIVRDGGSDVSSIIDQYNDERIKYINFNVNNGKSTALNAALNIAQGEYIAYLDDDDFYLPNHLDVMVKAILYTEVDFVYSDSEERTIVDKGTIHIDFKSGNEFNIQRLEITNFIPNLAILHKNRLEYRYDESLEVLEDWDFLRRCAIEFGAEFAHIPILTNVYFVRVDGNSRNGIMAKNRELYMKTLNEISRKGVWWISCPISSEALRYKSWMLLNPQYRMDWLEKSLKTNPWNLFSQVDLADLIIKHGNHSEALNYLNRSVSTYPENYHKVSLLMELELERKNLQKSRDLGSLCLLLAPDNEAIIQIYSKLSRAYAGHDNTTSLLCYYKVSSLRNYEIDVKSEKFFYYLIKKIFIKFKREGLKGVMKAIKKRI
jgi:GT2 family glycosyltransferase